MQQLLCYIVYNKSDNICYRIGSVTGFQRCVSGYVSLKDDH